MNNDFYDAVSGRALRGISQLKAELLEYCYPEDLARILKEAEQLWHASEMSTGESYTPYFCIFFDAEAGPLNYTLRVEDRTKRTEHEFIGDIRLAYVENQLSLRKSIFSPTERNGAWNLSNLRLILSDKLKKFDKDKQGYLRGLLQDIEPIVREYPTEFAFDIDDDGERLSVVTLRNGRHFAVSSVYH
jgi:hypothetical protein